MGIARVVQDLDKGHEPAQVAKEVVTILGGTSSGVISGTGIYS